MRRLAMMVPHFVQLSLRLGPVTIHAFGMIVAAAILVGLELARRRFVRLGLDPKIGDGMARYAGSFAPTWSRCSSISPRR